jgi:hypothetical protein
MPPAEGRDGLFDLYIAMNGRNDWLDRCALAASGHAAAPPRSV